MSRAEFYPKGHVTTEAGNYARAHYIDAGKPYSVSVEGLGAVVVDRSGKNVLVSLDSAGTVFTDEASAKVICEKWNAA